MLRRCCFAASSSSLIAVSCAAASIATTATRTVTYTAQHEALAKCAAEHNFTSPIWIEEEDFWWTDKITRLKQPSVESLVAVDVPHLIDLYNLDCIADERLLAQADELNKELENNKDEHYTRRVRGHRSLTSRKVFGKESQEQLNLAAQLRGYESKLWIGAPKVRSMKAKLKPSSKTTDIVLVARNCKVWNTEQFEQAELLTRAAISGYRNKPFGGSMRQAVEQNVQLNDYQTGVFFTLPQLEHFGLLDDLVEGVIPLEVPAPESQRRQWRDADTMERKSTFYNLDDVADQEAVRRVLHELNRSPVAEDDTFAASGQQVRSQLAMAFREHRLRTAAGDVNKLDKISRYWMSAHELNKFGLSAVRGAPSVSTPDLEQVVQHETKRAMEKGRISQDTVMLYSVHQLRDPSKGFAVAGTKAML